MDQEISQAVECEHIAKAQEALKDAGIGIHVDFTGGPLVISLTCKACEDAGKPHQYPFVGSEDSYIHSKKP